MTVEVGQRHETSFVVTEAMKPGHLPVVVLSTPDMIRQVEGACAALAQAHLDEGRTTVGTHVCVSHTGAAFEGEEVGVAVVVQAVDGRRLTFAIEVRSPRAVISTGTHERTVVRTDRYRTV